MRSTSHYFLEAIGELGIDYLFCNLGTDHAPLIEEMARWRSEGREPPQTVLCPHENVAVHMAAGYAVATGKGQAVLVHVDAGTANSAMALHNLCRARIPVLLAAGRAPFTTHGELDGSRDTYVHFVQEPFDQGSIVRPYVKWEYTLPSGVVAKEALRRAHSVMHSDPTGPVYLMLPREVLAQSWEPNAIRSFDATRHAPLKARGTDPQQLAELAKRLIAAREPLLITSYAGRNPEAPAIVDALARYAGIRVCEFNPVHLNIRRDSPCFGGWQPSAHVTAADVGLLVDVDVPWIPKDTAPDPQAFWAHIDVDAVKRDFPMWSYPADVRIEGDSARILAQLLEAMQAIAPAGFAQTAARRVEQLASAQRARAAQVSAAAAEAGEPGRLNPQHVCAQLGRLLSPRDVVLNEAIRNAPAVFAQIPRTEPGSLIGLAGGGLGFSGGMALGVKLARRDRTVVQVVGDGTFYFCNPEAVYAVSRQYDLPILTVVLDNSGWAAVKEATLRMYPDGHARRRSEYESLLAPKMDFAKIAESAGAYGEVLEDPAQTGAALERCLDAVRSGRSAVLHARVAPL